MRHISHLLKNNSVVKLTNGTTSLSTRRRRGFTLVELVICIVVIGILASLVIVAYNTVQSRARDKVVLSDADILNDLETNYGIKNNKAGLAWYSGNGVNPSLNFTPSKGTVIDVVVNSTDYCIRAYNPDSSTYKNLATAAIKESSPGACTVIVASNPASGLPSCASGFVSVPGSATYGTSNFCISKYPMKQASSTVPISQAAGSPWVNVTQNDAIALAPNVAGCSGCHLITDAEWLTVAQNVMSVGSNWSGGTVGSGAMYVGHTDGAPGNTLASDTDDTNGYYGVTNTGGSQRRTLTLTTGAVIWDFVGNVNTWTSDIMPAGMTPGRTNGYTNWTDYNDSTVNYNGLSSIDLPSTASPSAANWTHSNQGIGMLRGAYTSSTSWAYMRGCYYAADIDPTAPPHCGIFTLYFGNTPTTKSIGEGFRVTQTPQ